MPQETRYPDPAQLREFASEPQAFHPVHASDLDLLDDRTLRHTAGSVRYRWTPEYVNVETGPDEWHRVSDVDYTDMTYGESWNAAVDVEVGPDYVCATGTPNHPERRFSRYEAYWLLADITIRRPGDGGAT